jgi:hypothetical protein
MPLHIFGMLVRAHAWGLSECEDHNISSDIIQTFPEADHFVSITHYRHRNIIPSLPIEKDMHGFLSA